MSNAARTLQNKPVLGVMLMILSLAIYPLADAFFKHLMGTYSVHQTSFLRAFTRLIPLLIATFFHGGPLQILRTQHPRSHLIRLAVNLCYTLSFMYAFSIGSLTVVYTLSYTSPLFMIILSAIVLKESVGKERWFAVGIGMIGVIIAMRPGSNMLEMAAVLVLIGTLLGALNKILMRRLAATEHSLAIAIYPNLVMMAITLPFLFATWQSMPWEHWALFGFVGLLTAIGQYAITQALRFAQGSILAPVDYSSFIWVVSLDFLWWHQVPDSSTLIGAAIIIASNFYILYRARQETKSRENLSV